MKKMTYRKGRTLMTALVLSGLVLTGWTVLLVAVGQSLPVFA